MASDPMTPIDAKLIAKEVIQALKKEHSQFWIDPKTHYDCHQNFNRWVEFFDECKEDITKFGRRFFFIGIAGLVLFGIYTAATFNI